jgi:hypothetical protein
MKICWVLKKLLYAISYTTIISENMVGWKIFVHIMDVERVGRTKI